MPSVDGRTFWVRRLRDILALHVADLGGDDAISEAERSILRRACCMTVELERMEMQFGLAGEAKNWQLELYGRTANTVRRHLEALGLRRRSRDVTPDLRDYIDAKAETMEDAE